MNLADKLERFAKECNPWSGYGYTLAVADLREALEDAVKLLRHYERAPFMYDVAYMSEEELSQRLKGAGYITHV